MGTQSGGRRRLRVGLLVGNPEVEFDASVCRGAMESARQADVNLVIFPGRYIDGVYADRQRTEYEYQYNTLFEFPAYSKFDVLVVLIGTLGGRLDAAGRGQFLSRFRGTPVITVASEVEGYPCVRVDNRTGMEEVVRHLIEMHGCTRIGFVSGPEGSDDAAERLLAYRSVLEQSGIAYSDRRVVYGDFSPYSGPKVEELLDADPDLEAIVFGNDQMAIAGYEVLRKRGLRPGRDILVTGFDDEEAAHELSPPLTTVSAHPAVLGYHAVAEAVRYVTTGDMKSRPGPSVMVRRRSCGCSGDAVPDSLARHKPSEGEAFCDAVCELLVPARYAEDRKRFLRTRLCDMGRLLNALGGPGIRDAQKRARALHYATEHIAGRLFDDLRLSDLQLVLGHHYRCMVDEAEDPGDRTLLSELFLGISRAIASNHAAYMQSVSDEDRFMNWQTSSITRDMMAFGLENEQSYLSVIDKLRRLHMTSSYLYTYDPVIVSPEGSRWHMPQQLFLKAYHNGDEPAAPEPAKQGIAPAQLFTHPYMPQDRQYCMLTVPLVLREEHYGLLVCELAGEYFHYIPAVESQLCAALRILGLVKQQADMQLQLRQSLIEVRESNQLLSELSKTDDLTGCLNRRGFYEEMRRQLRDAKPYEEALFVFADLDSLKTINDCFGHAEGDAAICSVGEILRKALGADAVIGRMGGDEFALCLVGAYVPTVKQILQRVAEETEIYNEARMAEKAYVVHISVGAYRFRAADSVEIGDLLSRADALLYEQKRHRPSILKHPEEEGE